MTYLQIDFQVQFTTPVHTTGNRLRWGADKAMALSPGGDPVIPATTLKGLLRASAEMVVQSWGGTNCHAPGPETMCQRSDSLCLVCRVFGNPRRPSALKFSQLLPARKLDLPIRSGVSISRQRRASAEQRLYFVETAAAPNINWYASASGYFASREPAVEAAALIFMTTRINPIVGGGRSRGLGWVNAWNVTPLLDGLPLTMEELKPYWETWSGGTPV